jgi:hypothetical protein
VSADGRIGVVYIAGIAYTGSTIIARSLAECPGVFYGGELNNIWQRAIVEGRPCRCGREVGDCPVWRSVLAGLPFDPYVDAASLGAAHDRLMRPLPLARTIARVRGGADTGPLDRYRAATAELYRAIGAATGRRIIIDSSKSAWYASLLASIADLDLSIVHVIRDPRATVYSHLRRRRVGPVGITLQSRRWVRWHRAADRLERLPNVRYVRVRYEDFAEDPASVLKSVGRVIGLAGADALVTDGVIRLTPKHFVGGNRSRATTGDVTIRPDTEWQGALPSWTSRVVALTTLPTLARSGYSLHVG